MVSLIVKRVHKTLEFVVIPLVVAVAASVVLSFMQHLSVGVQALVAGVAVALIVVYLVWRSRVHKRKESLMEDRKKGEDNPLFRIGKGRNVVFANNKNYGPPRTFLEMDEAENTSVYGNENVSPGAHRGDDSTEGKGAGPVDDDRGEADDPTDEGQK